MPRCRFQYPLQIEPLDKINLRLPASRFESALTDVVVIVCARKREVVRQQDVDRAPVLFLPRRIVFADGRLRLSDSVRSARAHSQFAGCLLRQPVRRHLPRASSGATLLLFLMSHFSSCITWPDRCEVRGRASPTVSSRHGQFFRLAFSGDETAIQHSGAGGRCSLRPPGVALGLRQDERALQHGLRVQREAFGRPWRADAVKLHRIGNVGFHLGGMTADACIACVAECRGGSRMPPEPSCRRDR